MKLPAWAIVMAVAFSLAFGVLTLLDHFVWHGDLACRTVDRVTGERCKNLP